MDRFAFPDGEMGTWACLGAVSDRTVRVWLRERDGTPATATLTVAGQPRAEVQLTPKAAADHVAAADLVLSHPLPGATFEVNVAGMTRTGTLAPAPGTPSRFAFAFGSCHQPFYRPNDNQLLVHPGVGLYPALQRELTDRRGRFVLLLGDQIYADGAQPMNVRHDLKCERIPHPFAELVEQYRHFYRGYFNQSGFRALLEAFPTHLIWDDHDIYDGWGSLLHRDAFDVQLFHAAMRAYTEYQLPHAAGSAIHMLPPFHHHFWYGDTGFFLFDLRSERDYWAGSLFGEQQRHDFHDFLQEAGDRGCPTIFIGTSVPVVHFSPLLINAFRWLFTSLGNDFRDRWACGPFRPYRDEVLETLFEWQTARPHRQVIILSGDVHAGALFRVTRRHGSGLIRQWTSSPLSTPTWWGQHLTNQVGSELVELGEHLVTTEREALVLGNNAGLIEVRPLPSGGHEVTCTLLGFDKQRQRLHPAARSIARPER